MQMYQMYTRAETNILEEHNMEIRNQPTSPIKHQTINIFGFAGHMVSVAMTQSATMVQKLP